MHLVVIFTIGIATLLTLHSSATPVSSGWTYGDIHEYAIKRGGVDDPTAEIVRRHIANHGKPWDRAYEDDITLDDGAVLVIAAHNFTPPAGPQKRQHTPVGGMTAFPWVSNCHDNVYFTWTTTSIGCYTYISNGVHLRMYSVYKNGPTQGIPTVVAYRDPRYGGSFFCPPLDAFAFDYVWTPGQTGECPNTPDGRGFVAIYPGVRYPIV